MNEYKSMPIAYIISERIKQLQDCYGKRAVQDQVLYGSSASSWLELHVNNLLLTYGTTAVLKINDEMFKKAV